LPRSIRIKTDGNSSKSTNLRYGPEIEKIIAAVDATTQEQSLKGEAQPRNRVLFAHRHEQVHGGRVWQPGLGRTTLGVVGDGRCKAHRKDDETYALGTEEKD
jgi:hypothetical protein